ncbi:MAG: hypothetical protein V4864_00275 [Pseudomonadota bacterium]
MEWISARQRAMRVAKRQEKIDGDFDNDAPAGPAVGEEDPKEMVRWNVLAGAS